MHKAEASLAALPQKPTCSKGNTWRLHAPVWGVSCQACKHACHAPSPNTQVELFEVCGLQELVESALAGYSVTVFAFGQTGQCDLEAQLRGAHALGLRWKFHACIVTSSRRKAEWAGRPKPTSIQALEVSPCTLRLPP